MPNIISDDVGSFPLPEGVEREEVERIGLALIGKSTSDGDGDEEKFSRIIGEIMQRKIDAELKRPNCPQSRDMVEGFFKPIENFQLEEAPLLIDEKFARIPEVEVLDGVAKEYYRQGSEKPLELRVCVTGPLELYLKKFGNIVEGDLLENLAKSVSRFIENSISDKEYLKTKVICIDEPSLGLNSNIQVKEDDLIGALEISTEKAGNLDIQIHLHSPLGIESVLPAESIEIIGIESAEDPKILRNIEKKELDSYDKFLRIGVTRSNIFGLATDYNEKFGGDVWKEKNFLDLVEQMESIKKIEKRLERAWKKFDERIKYAGPDCGLRAWPTQESAFQLLQNTARAIKNFNKNHPS